MAGMRSEGVGSFILKGKSDFFLKKTGQMLAQLSESNLSVLSEQRVKSHRKFDIISPAQRNLPRDLAAVSEATGVLRINLHWSLDVVLNEEDSRIWAEESGKNFSLLRKMVLNLFKREPAKKGIRRKRKIALMSDAYLFKILFTG